MWWSHGDWGWGTWLVMSLVMVAFWGVVIWAAVSLTRNVGGGTSPREATPEDILAERLARGDIDEVEYRRRIAALHAPPEPDMPDSDMEIQVRSAPDAGRR